MSDEKLLENPALANAKWWTDLWETVEHWAFLLVIVALAVEFAATHFVKSPRRILEEARELEIARLQSETQSANARTKEAELKVELLRRQAAARRLDRDAFVKALEGKPKPERVEIWYLEDTSDGLSFAMDIFFGLTLAEWPVGSPDKITSVQPRADPTLIDKVPRLIALGAQPSGVSIVSNKSPDLGQDTPLGALGKAVLSGIGPGAQVAAGRNDSVPEGTLRVFVAAKPDVNWLPPPTPSPTK